MRRPRVRMLLLIDENVPESVAAFFRERGHDVRLVRELFPRGTPDPVIATLDDRLAAIVVTWNHRDFKRLAARIPAGTEQRFRHLSRINFRCNEVRGRQRAEAFIESIEFEYEHAQQRRDKRLMVEITETGFRVVR
jgi:predicted nuclease of predicted toxin-antitoxin system